MLAKYLCLLVGVVVVANSAPPAKSDRRCLPMQWEGDLFSTGILVNKDESLVYTIVAMVSYDYSGRRKAIFESLYSGGNFIGNYTILITEKQYYFINTIKMTCKKRPGFRIKQLCSDSSSLTYLTSWTIGGMMTDTYEGIVRDTITSNTITFLRDRFTVVSQVISQKVAGKSNMMAFQYGNVTEGIADSSVFDIPSYCNITCRSASCDDYSDDNLIASLVAPGIGLY